MEWHAADGSVMTQDQWNAQAAGDAPVPDAAEAETVEATDDSAEVPATQGAGDNAGE